jgi:hypothetical protein
MNEKKLKPLLLGIAFAVAVSLSLPYSASAEEAATTAQDTTQSDNVPLTEVEVKDNKL